jgi:hypothetical protein
MFEIEIRFDGAKGEVDMAKKSANCISQKLLC